MIASTNTHVLFLAGSIFVLLHSGFLGGKFTLLSTTWMKTAMSFKIGFFFMYGLTLPKYTAPSEAIMNHASDAGRVRQFNPNWV